jgi:hypothetical protein
MAGPKKGVNVGLDLRRKFALVTLLISTPVIIYLLLQNNASWLTSILIAVLNSSILCGIVRFIAR